VALNQPAYPRVFGVYEDFGTTNRQLAVRSIPVSRNGKPLVTDRATESLSELLIACHDLHRLNLVARAVGERNQVVD
jgi:hypothetical protein